MFTGKIRYSMLASALLFLSVLPGCDDDDDDDNTVSPIDTVGNNLDTNNSFEAFPLVSDTTLDTTAGSPQSRLVDSNLANPWGMVRTDVGLFWVADNHTGKATVYTGTGDSIGSPITIPAAAKNGTGAPTGLVRNTSLTAFKMPGGSVPAFFLFAGEDGTVSGWNSGSTAKIVINHSSDSAVYKGITIAKDSGRTFLYLANFKGMKVEVYDSAFKRDTLHKFIDSTIPAGFGPFNIALVDSQLYVTYAKLDAEGEDDEAGAGNGYVNVFTTRGVFVKRFASQGALNSPWGVTKATGEFGSLSNAILIGNFGDGHILGYDASGNFIAEAKKKDGNPVVLEGLWEILWVPSGSVTGVTGNALYYTAGPNDETNGVFGYLTRP